MSADTLRDELLALAGVAEAEIDEGGDSPSGVRIRLAPDADPAAVGLEVQRVLASHGMRSRVTDDDDEEEAEAPPPPITTLPVTMDADEFATAAETIVPPLPSAGDAAAATGLSAVRVEEGPEGIAVIVSAVDGRSATRRGPVTEAGMMEAVAAAAGDLAADDPPEVLAIERLMVDGTTVVTVVVEQAGGSRTAGAAVVKASAAYAVARATWSALAG